MPKLFQFTVYSFDVQTVNCFGTSILFIDEEKLNSIVELNRVAFVKQLFLSGDYIRNSEFCFVEHKIYFELNKTSHSNSLGLNLFLALAFAKFLIFCKSKKENEIPLKLHLTTFWQTFF